MYYGSCTADMASALVALGEPEVGRVRERLKGVASVRWSQKRYDQGRQVESTRPGWLVAVGMQDRRGGPDRGH